MDVTAVVVSWNVRELLDRCLASLGPDTRTIVVDNASSDGSGQMVREKYPSVTLIENDRNRGFAAACNQGIALAEGDAVLLLNPDAELLPGALTALCRALEEDRRVGAAGPLVLGEDGRTSGTRRRFPTPLTGLMEGSFLEDHFPRLLRRYRYLDEPAATEVDWMEGCGLLLRRAALEQVGPLDEQFFMYFEEVDWFLRARAAGWRARYVPEARVCHEGGGSSRQVQAAAHLYYARSKCAFYAKHMGPVAGRAVQASLVISYLLRAIEDGLKLALGHRPALRRERIGLYLSVLGQAARL